MKKFSEEDYKPRRCEACRKFFAPAYGHPHQKYCSKACCDRSKISEHKPREKLKPKPRKTLADWEREANECNLDYGNYRVLIASGKTFEELKIAANNRAGGGHAHRRKVY